MTRDEGYYLAGGVFVGVAGTYLFIRSIVLPKVQRAVENGVTMRVMNLVRQNTGIDPAFFEPLVRREVAAPISQAVIEALP